MKKSAAEAIWTKACKHLESVLHPDVYERWIAVIDAHELDDHALTLAVDNDFYQTWLEENYLPLIRDALTAVDGESFEISFVIQPRSAVQEPEPATPRKRTIRDRLARRTHPEPPLNPKFSFDSFIVGSSNNFAHAASLAVAQAPARAYNPLFIYGDVGLGKTHLMQAIGHHVMAASSRASVCYMSSETMLNEYISALQNRSLVNFRKKYRSTDLLLIDDIHFLAGKERIQEEFFHTFNALFDSHKQIVMTSDRPASEISGLEQRLVSRFEWGLVTELEPPDFETRVAILRNKQAEANVEVDDEIIQFIAENVRSNIRRLEGALVRALSYASLTGRDLTLDTLRYLLRDAIEQEHSTDLTLEGIQKTVAEHYDIRLADMTSTRRPRSIAVPRQVAMYLCRSLTSASLPDIATVFCKTHATVLHAHRAVGSRMEVDTELHASVSDLARRLGRPLPTHADV